MALFRNKFANRAFYVCLAVVMILLILPFLILPLAFRFFPSLSRGFIFQPNKEIPENLDFRNPENSGFVGGRNFYLTTDDDATLGVWHTLPLNLEEEAQNLNLTNMDEVRSKQIYNDWLSDATVFLYLHGSAGTRTSPHRMRVYRLLNQLNYHLITFDYRGYGDSSSTPLTESDLVEDTLTVYAWIKEQVLSGDIYVWGHSLGTGIAAHIAREIESKYDQLNGIVLEAPFSNMADAVLSQPVTKIVSFLPWFDYCFIEPLYKYDLGFVSDKHLKNTSLPIIILHAKDDKIVPYNLGVKLYEGIRQSRKDPSNVQLIGYDSTLGYGHYNIALDPTLNNTIRHFVESS